MDEVSVRLPAAPPAAYRRFLRWARDVMDFVASRPSGDPMGSPPAPISEPALRQLAAAPMAELELQVAEAERVGLAEVEPLLTGDPLGWRLSLAYGERIAEWLRSMEKSGTEAPRLDPEVEELRREVRGAVRSAVEGASVLLDLLPGEEPGAFRLVGELDMTYADALTATFETELLLGHRLTLDLSGLTFMDSTGIRLLISLARKAQAAGLVPIALLSPGRSVRHILDIALPSGIPGIEVREAGGEDHPGRSGSKGLMFFVL